MDELSKGSIQPSNKDTKITGIRGETPGLGDFTIKIVVNSGTVEHESYLSTVAPGLHLLKETVVSALRLAQDRPNGPKKVVLAGELLPMQGSAKKKPNFISTQLTVKLPFSFDVVFESSSFEARPNSLVGNVYSDALLWHQRKFGQRFEETFKLEEKGYGFDEVKFAEATLSNMMGSIGYFYGTSRVQSSYTKEPVPYWKAPLYSVVPSRSQFPRGFLWDEGFHGFLVAAWDLNIELDIMSYWFDLMNVEGWIPREQILGKNIST